MQQIRPAREESFPGIIYEVCSRPVGLEWLVTFSQGWLCDEKRSVTGMYLYGTLYQWIFIILCGDLELLVTILFRQFTIRVVSTSER